MTDPFEVEIAACVNDLCELQWASSDPMARAQACIEFAIMQLGATAETEDYVINAAKEAIDHYGGGNGTGNV